MYTVTGQDRVVKLEGVPQSSAGAPSPVVLSDEHKILLAYLVEETPQDWDRAGARVVDYLTSDEPLALVEFRLHSTFMFGAPNDEAFSGHPLAGRGLRPYGAFEIEDSSWVRQLERMNSVHPYHRPERFAALKHFVFAFHDSTFECVAEGFAVSGHRGALESLFPGMLRRLTA